MELPLIPTLPNIDIWASTISLSQPNLDFLALLAFFIRLVARSLFSVSCLGGRDRNLDTLALGKRNGLLVACVHVAGNADSGIVGQHTLDAAPHHLGSVGHGVAAIFHRLGFPVR